MMFLCKWTLLSPFAEIGIQKKNHPICFCLGVFTGNNNKISISSAIYHILSEHLEQDRQDHQNVL